VANVPELCVVSEEEGVTDGEEAQAVVDRVSVEILRDALRMSKHVVMCVVGVERRAR
jgi:hypothetical protein